MIKAKITVKTGVSLERELPANIHELHHALTEMGIRKTPRSILLMDDNAADVELTADSEIGSRLLRVFTENDTLADANTVAFAVSTAREEILPELEQNVMYDTEGETCFGPSSSTSSESRLLPVCSFFPSAGNSIPCWGRSP